MRSPELIRVPSEDGIDVAVHDHRGSGRPILFVHGTGMCARMWEPIMDRLPANMFRCIAVDLRGHGQTVTPVDTQFHDHRMIADLTAVIDALEIDDAFVVGHSMGGGTAILTSIDRPEAFRRIWTFEPIIMPPVTKRVDNEFLDAIRRRRSVFPDRQTVFDRYSTRPPLDELHPDCLWAYLEHGFLEQPDGQVVLACDPAHESRAFEQFDQQGFARLGAVSVPVLVASGGAEPDYPPAIAAPLVAGAIRWGRHELWSEARHFGPFADLDRAAASITTWFAGER